VRRILAALADSPVASHEAQALPQLGLGQPSRMSDQRLEHKFLLTLAGLPQILGGRLDESLDDAPGGIHETNADDGARLRSAEHRSPDAHAVPGQRYIWRDPGARGELIQFEGGNRLATHICHMLD